MKKPIILSVLGLVLVIMIGRAFMMGPPAPPPSPPADTAGAAPAATATPAPATAGATAGKAPVTVDVDKLLESVEEVDFAYAQGLLPRNPMTPLVGPNAVFAAGPGEAREVTPTQQEAEVLAQRLSVTGILYDEKYPVAVINDDVVAPGDVLPEGAVIQAIEPEQVVVRVGTSTVPLPLKRLEEQ